MQSKLARHYDVILKLGWQGYFSWKRTYLDTLDGWMDGWMDGLRFKAFCFGSLPTIVSHCSSDQVGARSKDACYSLCQHRSRSYSVDCHFEEILDVCPLVKNMLKREPVRCLHANTIWTYRTEVFKRWKVILDLTLSLDVDVCNKPRVTTYVKARVSELIGRQPFWRSSEKFSQTMNMGQGCNTRKGGDVVPTCTNGSDI